MNLNLKELSIARYWLAAADTGWAKKGEWQAWADKLILATDVPDEWLICLSLAQNPRELRSALLDCFWLAEFNLDEYYDAVLGCLWQRYLEGEISLAECLDNAGSAADGNPGRIECETIYILLNELEATENEDAIRAKASDVFSEVHRIAMKQWKVLHPNP